MSNINYEQDYVEYLIEFLEEKIGKCLNIVSYTITPEGGYILFDGEGKEYKCSFHSTT